MLGHDQEPVFRSEDAVEVAELERRRKRLDLGSFEIVAIGNSPNSGLACTYEQHVGAGRNRHAPCIKHKGIKEQF